MANVQLSISLALETKDIDTDLLFMEQKAFNPYAGKLTKGAMAIATLGWIYPNLGYTNNKNCGGEGSVFQTTIFVYLYDQDLAYNIAVSSGSIGNRSIIESTYVEIIKCDLNTSVDFSYPCEEIVSAIWVGSTYDSVGGVINKPNFTNDNRSLFFSEKVYGSLRVKYKVKRHFYGVTISSRYLEDDTVTENKYQSVVYANWDGGIKYLEIEAPEGFEDFDGDCGNGDVKDIVRIIQPPDDGDDDPPKGSAKDKYIYTDLCTGEIRE